MVKYMHLGPSFFFFFTLILFLLFFIFLTFFSFAKETFFSFCLQTCLDSLVRPQYIGFGKIYKVVATNYGKILIHAFDLECENTVGLIFGQNSIQKKKMFGQNTSDDLNRWIPSSGYFMFTNSSSDHQSEGQDHLMMGYLGNALSTTGRQF